jgi:integrase
MRTATGKVERRGKSWSYRFAYTDSTGRRRWSRRGGFATKSDAQRALTAAVAKANAGGIMHDATGTTGDFLAAWLDDYERRGTVKPSAAATVRFHVERHLIPRLGSLPLAKLRPATISKLYGDLLTGGRLDGGRGLSPKTVRNIAGTLHKALGEGVRWGILPTNPADGIELPKWNRPRLDVFDAGEVAQFLAHAERVNDPNVALWRLVFVMGLRRGELLGLTWDDVDLVGGRVSISQTRVTSPDGKTYTETPKTDAGRRTAKIDPGTVDALARLKDAHDAARAALGHWPSPFVATDAAGKPIRPAQFTKLFHRATDAAGLRRIRLHDLRHSSAVEQYRLGVSPAVISGRLGHSRVSTTQDLYLHYVPSHDAAAADLIGQTLDDGISSRARWAQFGHLSRSLGTVPDELDEHNEQRTLVNKGSADVDEHGKSAPPGIRTQDEPLRRKD